MNISAVRVFLIWLASMLAGVAIVWNSHFSADMSFFLPSKPSAQQQALIGQLQDGSVARLLMLSIDGGDPEIRARVSSELRQQLSSNTAFVSVQNGQTGGMEGELDLLLRYRYILSPKVTSERFSIAGLKSAVSDTIDLLSSPAGVILKPYLLNDPTGELLAMLGQISPASQPRMLAGVWSSRSGERAMLLLQTRALGSDTDGQEFAIREVRQTFERVKTKLSHSALELQLSGPGLFAVQARASIKEEVARLSLISSVAIWLILFWVYRSPRLLGLSLIPVLSGTLAGIVVVSLVHGTVFGITIGFGSALIGEAVDYAIYYFVQAGSLGSEKWKQTYWPTIRLGVLTTIIGFTALLFSGFPGLSQLGLYALAGVATAALVTRFVLPALAGSAITVRQPAVWVNKALALVGFAGRLRWFCVGLAILIAAYLWQVRSHLWDGSLSALSTISAKEAQIDARMRADLAAPDGRYLVTVSGADQEAALIGAERVARQLDLLVEQGVIGGYDSPARFLPSTSLQMQRQATLPLAGELRSRLQLALIDSPLSINKLTPFLTDIQAARTQSLLQRADLNGSALSIAVDSMLMPAKTGGWIAMMPLRPVAGSHSADLPADQLRIALAGSGAIFVDLKTEFDSLYNGYVDEAVKLALAGVAAITLLLAFMLRSLLRLLRIMFTLALTVGIVMSVLHLCGVRMHLLHLVGMLLIVAVGSNYALFFDRAAAGRPLDASTLNSLLVAALTTVIGFGTLAISNVSVLQAIGITVAPGALLALLLSATLVPAPKVKY